MTRCALKALFSARKCDSDHPPKPVPSFLLKHTYLPFLRRDRVDAEMVFWCINGQWVIAETCKSPEKCVIDGQRGHCALRGSRHARDFTRARTD